MLDEKMCVGLIAFVDRPEVIHTLIPVTTSCLQKDYSNTSQFEDLAKARSLVPESDRSVGSVVLSTLLITDLHFAGQERALGTTCTVDVDTTNMRIRPKFHPNLHHTTSGKTT